MGPVDLLDPKGIVGTGRLERGFWPRIPARRGWGGFTDPPNDQMGEQVGKAGHDDGTQG